MHPMTCLILNRLRKVMVGRKAFKILQLLNEESDEFMEKLLTEMIYLCTFGFEDPIRDSVAESIRLIGR